MRGFGESALSSLRHDGFWITVLKLRARIVDLLFDMRYGVDTCRHVKIDDLDVEGNNKDVSLPHYYQPTRVLLLRKLFSAIQPLLPDERVLVDFGCGKGRVLLVASEFGFREAKGVEFASELCEVARRNCAAYQARSAADTQFRIIRDDVVRYPIEDDDNVFFLFNPCNHAILQQVISNITASLSRLQREIIIIYHNPLFREIIEQQSKFVKVRELEFWSHEVVIYSNLRAAPPALIKG